ncbi:MAG: hypothetical protein Q9208_006643 [Pyrenodesmia sp. 3 TL-2023]
MAAVGRCLEGEIRHLRLQFLKFDGTDRPTSDVLAHHLLRLHPSQSLSGESKKVGEPFSALERELTIQNGVLLIPRYLPVASTNMRLNSELRRITRDMDLSNAAVKLDVSGSYYRFLECVQLSSDQDLVEVTVSKALLNAITIAGAGCLHVLLGHNIGGETVIALTGNNQSIVWIPQTSLAKVEDADIEDSSLLLHVAAELLASIILNHDTSGFVLVHEPHSVLAASLKTLAAKIGKALTMTSVSTTTHGAKMIHPASPERVLVRSVSRNVTTFADLSHTAEAKSVRARFGKLLPVGCDIKKAFDLYSAKGLRTGTGDISGPLRKVVERAIQSSGQQKQKNLLEPNVTAASTMPSQGLQSPGLQIIDWEANNTLPVTLIKWMVCRGARYIALASRNLKVGPQLLELVHSEGAVVKTYAMDVTSWSSVQEVHKQICNDMPRIVGVMNGAMILIDALFTSNTHADFEKTLRPKVDGTVFLDEVFSTAELDIFIVFASLAAVSGNRGQTAYAAAKPFMCSLIARRRMRGSAGSALTCQITATGDTITDNDSDDSAVRGRLIELNNEDDVHNVILKGLIACLYSRLNMNPDQGGITSDTAIVELGVDSLLAVDLRAWLTKELDLNMPVLKLMGGATVEELVEDAVKRLSPELVPNLIRDGDAPAELGTGEKEEELVIAPLDLLTFNGLLEEPLTSPVVRRPTTKRPVTMQEASGTSSLAPSAPAYDSEDSPPAPGSPITSDSEAELESPNKVEGSGNEPEELEPIIKLLSRIPDRLEGEPDYIKEKRMSYGTCLDNYEFEQLTLALELKASEYIPTVFGAKTSGIPTLGRTGYNLTVDISKVKDTDIRVSIRTQKYLYSVDATKLLFDNYMRLVKTFAASFDTRVDSAPLWDDRDIEAAKTIGHGPRLQSEWPETVSHRIAEIATQHPDKEAVGDGSGNTITYGKLQQRIQLISNTLTQAGVEKDLKSFNLHNFYWPAESITCDIPAGFPLLNYAVYIVDRNLELASQGVTGEILIGGPSVAYGYLNDEKLGDNRFISNPWDNGIVYRTGDMGYFNKDGAVMFRGRIAGDTQVKIRGIRIDLEDIEASILTASERVLHKAVVSIRGGDMLAAHVQFAAGHEIENSQQKAFLRQLRFMLPLPIYMIPAIFMPVDQLPVNTHGKTDRSAIQALPLPKAEQGRTGEDLSDTENHVVVIWKEVVPKEMVDAIRASSQTSFFELGGNSLLLVRLQMRINKQFDIQLSLIDLFGAASLGAMAAKVEAASLEGGVVEGEAS